MAEHGLDLLIVDYIQLMQGRGRFENRTLELGSISRSLKGLAKELNIPVLGVIENMSTHICPECGHESAIFGSGGADRMSADFDVEVLGRLPLDAEVREMTDSGRPTVAAAPDSPAAKAYTELAQRVAQQLAIKTHAAAEKGSKFASFFGKRPG